MKRILAWGFWVSVAACSSSGGTETDNPAQLLKDFSASECKSGDDGAASALTLTSEVAGLQCVEWEAQLSGDLRVVLHNFTELCAKGYDGKATAKEGSLELSFFSTSCTTAKCDCLYDYDYTVSGITIDEPLELKIGTALCASEPPTFEHTLTLPLDEQPSGIVCKPAVSYTLRSFAESHNACGQANMPCGQCDGAERSCGDGLVCTELSEFDSRCLSTCETDADCPFNLSCEAGGCSAPAAAF